MASGFVWGGFEGASHRRADGERVDSVAASGHDRWATLDHAILSGLGIGTVRESLRWHLIEHAPGCYDFASARHQLEAARHAGMSVVWGLCHWGVPDHLDVMDADFHARFAAFAHAAAGWLRAEGADVAAWVPINEIAFWAWAGGETGGFAPFLRGSGDQLKQQLIRCHLAAVDAIRRAGAHQPIMLCEPLTSVLPADGSEAASRAAAAHMEASFAAVREIRGASAAAIDILGVNFYPHNQWRTDGTPVRQGEAGYRGLADLLGGVADAFPGLPLAITETGAEEPEGARWLTHIADELEIALAAGIPVIGACIYPVADYPGWDNARHCACGPIGTRHGRRFVREGHRAPIARLAMLGQRERWRCGGGSVRRLA
jgi:hypothetical protein